MKGQMFILTMVFLVGLIFTVQSMLLEYNYVDLSGPIEGSDEVIMMNIRNSIRDTVAITEDCSDVSGNLEELEAAVSRGMLSIYGIDIYYDIKCSRWNNTVSEEAPVEVHIRISTESSETTTSFSAYHNITG